jgi:4-hydroxy-4-methyl-2-oxoglutarate aldolase
MSARKMLTKNLEEHLLSLGTATLHEAAGRRYLVDGVRLLVGEPFAGKAATVALPAGDNLGVHLAIEAATPGSVVCVASAGKGLYGVVGDLLVEAARARGVRALVVADGIRDLAALRPPPAIAATAVTIRGTQKARVQQDVASEIALGGTLVAPGDWIVADHDGVVALPAETTAEIITRAEERVAREAAARPRLRKGESSRRVLGLE